MLALYGQLNPKAPPPSARGARFRRACVCAYTYG